MAGCKEMASGRGLCQHHYDQWYGKIRRERDKQRKRDKPFLRFKNPYRQRSGYHIVFEVIRQNQPLTTEQVIYRSKIELAKDGLTDYRIDYAFEVLRAKIHSSKRGDYQMRKDAKGRWHLIRERGGKEIGSNGENP
jgi:hypothetical protein